jgi:hypothetical protein
MRDREDIFNYDHLRNLNFSPSIPSIFNNLAGLLKITNWARLIYQSIMRNYEFYETALRLETMRKLK